MPQIPANCEFDVEADQIELKTKRNGDFIEIRGINLNQNQSSTLAWLINADNHLTVEIKIKGE